MAGDIAAQEQVGISPKVKLPAAALTAIGVVLIVIGYAIGDHTVAAVGWSLLGGGPLAGLLGYIAPPGVVRIPFRR